MKSVAVTILILSLCFPALTQDRSDNDLALQYFRDKDYEKAAELYGSLYDKSLNKTYYMYYILCLTELKRYDDAEKVIKRQTRKYPDDLSYIVDLGFIYKQQGKIEDGESEYDKAIKKMLPSQNSIIGLANAFIAKRELKMAEETYITGKKLIRGDYTFSYELASVYRYQRNFQKMIDEYLDLLLTNENYIQSVQNSLQATIYSEDQEDLTNILKNSLILRIQKYPQVTIFNELLIWLYLQDKDFENAFYQSKALDKRNNEQGYRILTLGDLAVENRMWDIAVKCFRYVIDLGENGILYLEGKYSYLDALYKKIKATGEFTPQEISDLEQNYIATLDELGRNAKTVGLVIELAHIRAFYMSKMDEAIQMLEEALLIPGINQSQISQCKLELGDIFIFSGDPWEATLYYAQVEKANENNPTGHEAKFRKAKLAYYTGEFKWAQAQLDVLKASTSKLIANDAFELASLINDNTALDTTEAPLRLFSRADLLLYRNQDSLAVLTLDSIGILYPKHSLADEILYRKANICMKHQDYEQAAVYYREVIEGYSYDILADNSLFRLAGLYETKLDDMEKAKELYQRLITEFPGSIYVVDARKRFRILRGDKLKPASTEENFFRGISP